MKLTPLSFFECALIDSFQLIRLIKWVFLAKCEYPLPFFITFAITLENTLKLRYIIGMRYFLIILALLSPFTASAARYQVDLPRIERYLNDIDTIVADFSQVAPDGSLTGGMFYLKRPGNMRWEYAPPTPVLIVASDGQLVFYDAELKQVSYYPIDETLAGFLAKDTIRFDDTDVRVKHLQQDNSSLRLTLVQKDRPNDGELSLEFSDKPLQLRNIVVKDMQGQLTTISLTNAKYGQALPDKLFVFKDPRKKKMR